MGRKKKWLQVILLAVVALVILALVGTVLCAIPGLLQALRSGGEGTIEDYLAEMAGVKGMVCTGLLQFFQVISIVIPGMPIQFAAGIVYGVWRGFLLCHLSYLAANICVFCVARHFKGRIENLGLMKKKSGKLDFIRKSSYPAYMTALACLIPVLPNGIVPYVACQTKLTVRRFAVAVWCGSFLPILAMCAVGSRVIAGEYFLAIALFVVFLAAVVLLTVFHKRVISLLKVILEKFSFQKEREKNQAGG